jgi:glycosyltransferase involved in cell wall biosynthesis
MRIKVVFFFRKPFTDYFSIEELFGSIQSALPTSVEFENVYMKWPSKGLWLRFRNAWAAISKQADINHITGDVHYIAAFLSKRKTILTIHDLEVLKRLKGVSRAVIKFFWFTMPAVRVKYITVISQYTKNQLLKEINVNPDKVVVINNSVNPAITWSPKEFNTVCPNILHIGTGHNKNLERLIEALQGLNIQLTIIGHIKDHQKELLARYSIKYRNLFNLPFAEVVRCYQEADIVSFTSLYEGFGLPIIEANAVGRPVLTSTTTSMPEVAGDAALLVDPEKVEQIKEAIEKLISDAGLREKLVANGRENVKRFLPSAIAQKYADLYAKVIHENKH